MTDDTDALCILQGWWVRRNVNLNGEAVEFAAVDRELNLMPDMAKRLLEKAVQKHNYVVDTKGDKYITFRLVSPSTDRCIKMVKFLTLDLTGQKLRKTRRIRRIFPKFPPEKT